MATPSPSSSPSPSPSPSPKPVSTTTKKTQPLPWTHQETVHLIQAYQDKWYSLKRGQLKASQWEEVAVTVAARCGYDHSEPSKTSTQCRHKMEKLRKRYRSEKQRLPFGGACSWQYFDLMDRLDRGPLPISARPLTLIPKVENNSRDDDEEDEEEDENKSFSKSRSINYILRRPTIVNRFGGDPKLSGGAKGVSGFSLKKKSEMVENDDDDDDEGEVVVERQRGVVSELAKEVRAFAERFVGMENRKIEMMRDAERCRMEMESKRMEMILQSQQKILDTIAKAFGGAQKKLKVEQES